VVDGSESDTDECINDDEESIYETESESESNSSDSKLYVEDVGSELSEEEYEY